MNNKITSDLSQKAIISPLQLGAVSLEHRVVMAPLTRLRSDQPGDIPNKLMSEYYGQRASSGGLIISEATTVAITGRGYLGAPGIYSDEQVAGWQSITESVHAKGGIIFLQLWHVGRVAHVDLTGGLSPVAPSVVPFESRTFTRNGWVPSSPARALETDEIPAIVDQYLQAAKRAKEAGFDGVEIHAANGYLIDQFLQDGSNKRTDKYGGSAENRSRILFEVLEAILTVWEAGRVGVRLSPSTKFNSMSDSNPEKTFGYIAQKLDSFKLAYLHVIEPRVNGSVEIEDGLPPTASVQLRKVFTGKIIAAGGFNPKSAESFVQSGAAELIAFGRYFISNPDLPKRIENDVPLQDYDRDTFYGGDAHGYTDYPVYHSAVAAAV